MSDVGSKVNSCNFITRQMRVKPAELSSRATYWQDRPKCDTDEDDSDIEEEMESLDHSSKQPQVR